MSYKMSNCVNDKQLYRASLRNKIARRGVNTYVNNEQFDRTSLREKIAKQEVNEEVIKTIDSFTSETNTKRLHKMDLTSLQDKVTSRIYFDKASKQILKKKKSCKIVMYKKYKKIHTIVNETLREKLEIICDIVNNYVDDVINITIDTNKFNVEYSITIDNTFINYKKVYVKLKLNMITKIKYITGNFNNSTVIKPMEYSIEILQLFNTYMKKFYNKKKYIDINSNLSEYDLFNQFEKNYVLTDNFTSSIIDHKLLKNIIVILKMVVEVLIRS
jgi:hypothetical protein